MKIYKSKNGLAISVTLDNGCNRYLSFDSVSDGSARLRVKDKRLMKAIEKHRYFNKLFFIYYDDEPKQTKPITSKVVGLKTSSEVAKSDSSVEPLHSPETVEDITSTTSDKEEEQHIESSTEEGDITLSKDNSLSPETGEESPEKSVMTFDCFDDARDFLYEKHGISKKRLMSKAMVITEAENIGLNIEFNN